MNYWTPGLIESRHIICLAEIRTEMSFANNKSLVRLNHRDLAAGR